MKSIFNTIKGLLLLLVIVCAAGLGLLFLQGQVALRNLEQAAIQMGDGKDIVADILPPPLYIIEPHLIAYQLLDTPLSERPSLAEKLKQLRSDYEARNTYWQEKRAEIDKASADSLLGSQKEKGEAYWELLDKEFLPAVLRGSDEDARKVFNRMKELYASHRKGVDATVEVAGAWAEERLNDLSMTARRTRWWFTGVAALCVGIAIALYLTVSRRIHVLLGAEPEILRSEMERLAKGDLRPSTSSVSRNSVLGTLRHAQERIRDLLEKTGQESKTVDHEVSQMRANLEKLQENAHALADSAMSTSSAIEEISASIERITEQAKTAEGAVSAVVEEVGRGKTAREESLKSVERIAVASERAQTSVAELGQHSQEVTGIVTTIRSIAQQTNLLALNAAIEAARAGRQGRGFAVVAEEVRKLAERTTHATEEIAKLIETIHNGIMQTVTSIDAMVSDIKVGRQSVDESERVLVSIHERVAVAMNSVSDIVNAVREVNKATRQINDNMATVSHLADTGAVATRDTVEVGKALSEVSMRLNQSLRVFTY